MTLENKIITRKDASALGLKWYFTGKPCSHGHISERQTSNGSCRECMRKRYDENIEKMRAYSRSRYHTDHEKELREQRKERKNESRRVTYHKNPDKKRAYMREQYRRDPTIWKYHAKIRKSRLKGSEGKYTIQDVKNIRDAQNDKCGYCGIKLKGGGHIDHITPLSKGGTNWPRNLQLLCVSCNCSKKATDQIEYAQKRLGKLL